MFTLFSRRGAAAPAISPAEAVSRVADGSLTLIDIRDPFERKLTGTAKGAIAIPLAAFRMKVDPKSPERHPDLDPSKPVALYCASGARSGMAAGQMIEMGYTQVYNLGGISHWRAGGGALV